MDSGVLLLSLVHQVTELDGEAFRKLGLTPSIKGFGSLLERLSPAMASAG